jgi:predicted nuclease of predicted toxin-antitoxin system
MDAIHVGEVSMAFSTDQEIMEKALIDERVVVTLDADFHALLAISGATKPSVIRIREEGMKGPDLCSLILQLWKKFSAELMSGCVITATLHQARLRMLPIHS